MKELTYLVSWSGGVDSTALINRLLKEGHAVEATYTVVNNNSTKVVREVRAITGIAKLWKPFRFELKEAASQFDISLGNREMRLHQPLLWLTSLFYSCHAKIDRVAIGYVLNDCAISYLNELKTIWRAMWLLTDRAPVPLEFPLMRDSKKELWDSLDSNVQKLVTWCESDKVDALLEAGFPPEPCGCAPCRRMRFLGLPVEVKRLE